MQICFPALIKNQATHQPPPSVALISWFNCVIKLSGWWTVNFPCYLGIIWPIVRWWTLLRGNSNESLPIQKFLAQISPITLVINELRFLFWFPLKKINIQQIFKWIPPETLNNQSFFSLRKKCLFKGKITTVWRWLCSFWLIGFDTAFECKRNHFSYQWKLEIKQSQVMFFFCSVTFTRHRPSAVE